MRNVQPIQILPFSVKPWIDITDSLACRLPDPEPVRTLEDITHLSIHHSGVEGGTIQGYANYHVKTLKWFHVGYHNVIKEDQLYQTNNWLTKSYHTASNNGYTLSCSISGDLSKRPMSEIERLNLYAWALTCLSIFPNLTVENIWGHNQFPNNNTACPCIDMQKVRDDINTLQIKMQRGRSWENRLFVVNAISNELKWFISEIQKGEGVGFANGCMDNYEAIYDFMDSNGWMPKK